MNVTLNLNFLSYPLALNLWISPLFSFIPCAESLEFKAKMIAVGLSYIAFIMLRYVPSIPAFWRNLQAINAGEGVEKREPSYTVGGNAN